MSIAMMLTALLQSPPGLPAPPPPPPPLVYTNEEQVYFAREAGHATPPWIGYRLLWIDGAPHWQRIDAMGSDIGPPEPRPVSIDGTADTVSVTEGEWDIILRRARSFTCWVSVRRFADRSNGEADWSFDRNLMLHDQGGRLLISPEGAPPVMLRMRNVVWPSPSPNRPSLVLYVHRPESPDRAESYSWADPDARMVGINLRWVQASCTRTGMNI